MPEIRKIQLPDAPPKVGELLPNERARDLQVVSADELKSPEQPISNLPSTPKRTDSAQSVDRPQAIAVPANSIDRLADDPVMWFVGAVTVVLLVFAAFNFRGATKVPPEEPASVYVPIRIPEHGEPELPSVASASPPKVSEPTAAPSQSPPKVLERPPSQVVSVPILEPTVPKKVEPIIERELAKPAMPESVGGPTVKSRVEASSEPKTEYPEVPKVPIVASLKVINVDPGDTLSVRQSPSASSPRIGRIPAGGRGVGLLSLSGQRNGRDLWFQILWQGKIGWVNGSFVDFE